MLQLMKVDKYRYMKIAKKNHKKKKMLITFVSIGVIALGALGVYYLVRPDTSQQHERDAAQRDTENATDSTATDSYKPEVLPQGKESAGQSDPNVDAGSSPEDIPTAPGASVLLEELSQFGSHITYRAGVTGFTEGLCSATFTSRLGRTVAKTTPITNGSCSQSIPEMEFDALGEWQLSLRVYHNNTQATAERNIVIK